MFNMGTELNVNVNMSMKEDRNSPEYLSQLLKDKKQIQAFPNVFIHMERLLDEGKLAKSTARYEVNTVTL